jgi:DNA-binding transcriptional MerR regulator
MSRRRLEAVRGLSLETSAPEAPENHLTIEQLSAEAGLSVRNIRSYASQGLLPPPEVRSRIGYYGPEHLSRLRLVGELRNEGLKLEGIKRLLDESHVTGEGLLRVRKAADAPEEVEAPEVFTAAELVERFGLEGEEAAKVLTRAEKLRILVPLDEGFYEVPSPSLLDAAEEAVRMGIALPRALEVMEATHGEARRAAQRFVKLFIEDVWKPFAAAGTPQSQWPAIAEAMERTRPLAARTLLAVFRQAMAQEVDETFAEIAKQLSEGKR